EGGGSPLFGPSALERLTVHEVTRRADELYQAWAAACGAYEADVWDSLSEEAKREHEEQAPSVMLPFTLKQLDANGLRSSGPIAAAARRDVMLYVGTLVYPNHLQNPEAFAESEGLLQDLSEEDRGRVLQDTRQRYLS